MPRFNSPSKAIVPNQMATNTQDRFSFIDLLLLISISGSRDKIYNVLCYLLTLVLLEKVPSIVNHNLWLIVRTGDKSTKENISSACDGVFNVEFRMLMNSCMLSPPLTRIRDN